jgi:hypothetical protein
MEAVTPDTTSYLVLAFAAAFGTMLLYIGSLALRFRSQQKDEAVLEELKSE